VLPVVTQKKYIFAEFSFKYISQAADVAGIDYCGGAIWCIVIPNRSACNSADGCRWVR
jgi:hypothetical protein